MRPRLEPAGVTRQHGLEAEPDHRVARPRHPDVADVGGPARQDAVVGCGHVRVGAQQGRHPASQVVQHDLLLAGGLGVELDDHRHPGRHALDGVVGGLEDRRVHAELPQPVQRVDAADAGADHFQHNLALAHWPAVTLCEARYAEALRLPGR